MIVRTRSGDVELRTQEWGSESMIPPFGSGWLSGSGVPVTQSVAMGLPAVSNVIRSPADIIASLPFMTYSGTPRERAESTWQWHVLHDEPDFQSTGTFTFFYDLSLSLEATQNTFLQKIKGTFRNAYRVMALEVLDPQRVRVYRDRVSGQKLFDVYVSDSVTRRRLTSDDILHVRGYCNVPGGIAGTSLLMQHKDAIGSALALQGFEGDYFRNDAQPPFWFTGAKNREHAKELLAFHNEQHQGAGKRWRAGAMWGDMDVKSIPIALRDAQFAETKQLSIEDACRIWRWPKELLELTSSEHPPADENAWTARVMKFYLLPRLRRIERAFAADRDLYAGSGLVGEFLTAALERADFVTRVRGYKDARQGGWITANEVRDTENLPPHEGGDTLLETPTGSAPNKVGPSSPDAPAARSRNGHEDREVVFP